MEHCTKCRINERKPKQRWCKACHAAYQREWRRAHRLKVLAAFALLARREKRERHREGRVYLVEAMRSGLIKIGWAIDPVSRLRALRIGSTEPLRIVATIKGYMNLEKSIHAHFADARQHGEWFRKTQELESFIATIQEISAEENEAAPDGKTQPKNTTTRWAA